MATGASRVRKLLYRAAWAAAVCDLPPAKTHGAAPRCCASSFYQLLRLLSRAATAIHSSWGGLHGSQYCHCWSSPCQRGRQWAPAKLLRHAKTMHDCHHKMYEEKAQVLTLLMLRAAASCDGHGPRQQTRSRGHGKAPQTHLAL
jgi:hypothetical protein